MTTRRFPQRVYSVGEDPDPRVSLANERTFLSWARMALALVAAGVALEGFNLDLNPQLRLAAALFMILAGIVVPIFAWTEWVQAERAIRLSQPLPGAHTSALLGIIVIIIGVLVLLSVLLR